MGNRDLSEGYDGHLFNDASLQSALAHEITSPTVLLRQLSLMVADKNTTPDKMDTLSRQLTLTSDKILRMLKTFQYAYDTQQEIKLETINPMNVCVDVVREIKPLFMAQGKKLEIKPRQHSPLLVANYMYLKQILATYLDNALPYCSAEDPVYVSVDVIGEKIRIGVRDHGPSVTINIWDEVVDRLGKAASPVASRPHLSSVGLAVSHKLASAMGCDVGHVRHSDGVTFYVEANLSRQMSLV